jgi:hypothetical protein
MAGFELMTFSRSFTISIYVYIYICIRPGGVGSLSTSVCSVSMYVRINYLFDFGFFFLILRQHHETFIVLTYFQDYYICSTGCYHINLSCAHIQHKQCCERTHMINVGKQVVVNQIISFESFD